MELLDPSCELPCKDPHLASNVHMQQSLALQAHELSLKSSRSLEMGDAIGAGLGHQLNSAGSHGVSPRE